MFYKIMCFPDSCAISCSDCWKIYFVGTFYSVITFTILSIPEGFTPLFGVKKSLNQSCMVQKYFKRCFA